MNIRVGYIPSLNMAPFYQGFGPGPMEVGGHRYEFWDRSPRVLGLEAEYGQLDAGPLSLIDALKMSSQYEPIGRFGVGVRRRAQSVFLFSKVALPFVTGTIAVTDDTSTSILLLQALLEQRYEKKSIQYGRIASLDLFDGQADGILLIGDEALRAKREGIRGFPLMADLGEEWFRWQHLPFVFARWMIRQSLPEDVKEYIAYSLDKSLQSIEMDQDHYARYQSASRDIPPAEIRSYWDGFVYRLTPDHEQSIENFSHLIKRQCLIA